jgi:pilus assembly protein Flp/PilA
MMDVILWSMVQGQNAWARVRDEERGQGLVEYALIIAIVALGVIVAIVFLKDQISDLFNRAGTELGSQPS